MSSSNSLDATTSRSEGRCTTPYRPSRIESIGDTLSRPSVLLSLLLVIHFCGSLLIWFIVCARCHPPFTLSEWLEFLWPATSAVVLFSLSVIVLFRSVRESRFSTISALFLCLLSASVSWYDVTHERAQIKVSIATKEYWEDGGSENTYFTWWWFNDAWLR